MVDVIFQDLGLIEYSQAWDIQEKLFADKVNLKIANRKKQDLGEDIVPPTHHLLFCEHPHVYTLGKSGDAAHLLLSEERLKQINAAYFPINRGGDITYHGPGQLVGYPLLDLDQIFTDIHKYLRFIEEAIILTLNEYGIKAGRIKEYTGVWIDEEDPNRARKICAIGVKSSRWVTMHGFAFNVNTDLAYFDYIVPCGIKDKAVTSLYKELGRIVDMEEVKHKVASNLANVFDFNLLSEGGQTIFKT